MRIRRIEDSLSSGLAIGRYEFVILVLIFDEECLNMPSTSCEKRTVSLPPEQGRYIDSLVESGAYASASEVVRAGPRALEERDAAVERWLRTEVVQAHDEIEANPSSAIPAEQVFAELRTHIASRIASQK